MFKKFERFLQNQFFSTAENAVQEYKEEVIVTAAKVNLSRYMVGEIKKVDLAGYLAEQDRNSIDTYLSPLLEPLDTLDPLEAMGILTEADTLGRYTSYSAQFSTHPLVIGIKELLENSDFYSAQYARSIINNKIIQIACDNDVIDQILKNHRMDRIIPALNLLSRAARLLKREENYFERQYNGEHFEAIFYLLCMKELSPKEIIDEIQDINGYQTSMLLSFYDSGLRGRHLRLVPSLSESLVPAFLRLINEAQLDPVNAFQEISELSIYAGYAVAEYYALGLRGSDLLNWDKPFTNGCNEVLSILIKKEKMPLPLAVNKLKSMTSEDVNTLLKSYEKLKKQKFTVVMGIFAPNSNANSSLNSIKNDEIFDPNSLNMVFDFLKPSA